VKRRGGRLFRGGGGGARALRKCKARGNGRGGFTRRDRTPGFALFGEPAGKCARAHVFLINISLRIIACYQQRLP
jgi:hypothetical protein